MLLWRWCSSSCCCNNNEHHRTSAAAATTSRSSSSSMKQQLSNTAATANDGAFNPAKIGMASGFEKLRRREDTFLWGILHWVLVRTVVGEGWWSTCLKLHHSYGSSPLPSVSGTSLFGIPCTLLTLPQSSSGAKATLTSFGSEIAGSAAKWFPKNQCYHPNHCLEMLSIRMMVGVQ